MGIITKGDNVFFINNPFSTGNPKGQQLLFTQRAADFSSNPDAVTQDGTTGNIMQVQGLAARIPLANLKPKSEIRAIRPQPEKVTIITIDPADATQFKLAAFTAGDVLRFFIVKDDLFGSRIEDYRVQPGERAAFGKEDFFSIRLRAGDTETTVLTRLAAACNDIFTTNMGKYPFKADFGVSNAGKFTLTGIDSDASYSITTYDKSPDGGQSSLVTTFKPFVAQAADEGQGNWATLQATYRLQTSASTEPYSLQQFDRVLPGALYTCLQFQTFTERPDLTSNELSDSPVNASTNTFTFYVINGAAGEALLTKMVNFLKRADVSVTQVYVLPDGTSQAVPGAAGSAGTFLAATA